VLCAVVLVGASFRVSAISSSRYFSSATSRQSLSLIAQDNRRNYSIMGKKCFVTALAVFTFGFGTALRSNAGTDMIEPYQAPARSYNYAPPPPPRPVAFLPPVRIGVFFGPGFGYYGPGYGYYGRGYGYGGHRYYGRQAYWRGPGHHWH
jgi:hypothetical protein